MLINVVAALIYKDNKILIAKRSTGNPDLLGKWEFPGGKVETGETNDQALKREIKEELDIEINVNKFITSTVSKTISKTIELKLYNCDYLSGKLNLHDHSDYKWIELKDLLNYDLAPSDINLAYYLLKNKN